MNNKTIIKSYVPAVLWSAFIFFLCFLPGNAIPKKDWLDKIYFDKIVHASLYFILFFLIIRIFEKKDFRILLFAGTLCMVQGILIEFIQGSSLIEHRSFDVFDIVANASGLAAALACFYLDKYFC